MAGLSANDRIRVMLVDDLPEMRRLVELWLEGSHVRVAGQAGDCAEAFALLDHQPADVIVMDLHMPGRDGVECTRELLEHHPRLVVIAFSSSDDPDVERDMRAAGAAAYFHKSELPALIECLTSPWLSGWVQERREG